MGRMSSSRLHADRKVEGVDERCTVITTGLSDIFMSNQRRMSHWNNIPCIVQGERVSKA